MLIEAPVYVCLLLSESGEAGEIVRISALRPPAERSAGAPRAGTPNAEPLPAAGAFERLARPARRFSLAQARATGLSNSALDAAPELDVALQDFLEFSAGAGAWIVPDGAAARASLDRAAARAGFPRGFGIRVLGSSELGALVHPTVCRRGVADLVAHYGLASCGSGGEAGGTTPALLQTLWAHLEEDLLKLPLPVLAELNWLLAKSAHPLAGLLKQAETSGVESQFSSSFTAGKLSIASLFKDFSGIIKGLQGSGEERGLEEEAPEPVVPVARSEAAAFLNPGGPLAGTLANYEERREQGALAGEVAEAFSSGRHLLAEAGTGVGKSLAYLVPAVLFAQRNGRPVIVSTHTKNLQSQLFHKDLPILRKALGTDFKAALLKGRPNYLCARKFMYTLQEAAHELDEDERAALLPVVSWATRTEDGDVAELAAFSPEQHPQLWDRLHTVGEDCLARQCPFYHRCYVYKARGLARAADVVVCNHALVFADLNQEHGALPAYQEIVFDEAHTLEDVATEHLACEIAPRRVYRMLGKLFRTPQGSSAGKGLLPALLFQLEMAKSEFPGASFESIRAHVLEAIQAIGPATAGTEKLFELLREWFEAPAAESGDAALVAPHVPRERGRTEVRGVGRANFLAPSNSAPDRRESRLPSRAPSRGGRSGEERRRYSAEGLRPDERELFTRARESAIAGLGRLRKTLAVLDEDFEEIRKREVARARELQKEIGALGLFLQELISDVEFVTQANEPNYVYWVERMGPRSLRAVGAPLDLAGLLHEQLYERKRSVVLTSATLSVAQAAQTPGSAGVPPAGAHNAAEPYRRWVGLGSDSEEISRAQDARATDSFDFLKQRLGLTLCAEGRLEEVLLGSPFDYARQCRLYLPTFLPEPESRDFGAALSAAIAQWAVASGGRALVLYTSYAALSAGAAALRKALAPEGIEVLAQGEDGSRETLLAKLKAGGRTILLGTASFWEGVDVSGAALSLLVIAKLPFAAFKDPIVQARCELLEAQGQDPFMHFSVPNAILRLRQGFGRLIRSKTDRGVVVLCDKRVLTKRYGAAFLRALPAQAIRSPDAERLVEEVHAFLAPSPEEQANGCP